LDAIRAYLHGGEPLLAGKAEIAYTATSIRAAVPDGTKVDFRLQTNGTLLTAEVLDVLLGHDIRVGVSLDGDRNAHDRHRRDRRGQGSYDRVARALELLGGARYRQVFGGLLCTIDLANDPIATYEALARFGPPTMDFILPHGNWAAPPPGWDQNTTPYGDWLVALFDHWYERKPSIPVRLFDEIVRLAFGLPGRTEMFGLAPVDLVVVETDGSMEQVDTLKSTFDGAAWTGLNVYDHSFDVAMNHPDIRARQQGLAGLSDVCQRCPIVDVCGGGYYPHRYRSDNGFANPSVYCGDLRRLIGHIVGRVHRDTAALRSAPCP
jgi:uncharacterized protein